MTIGAWTCGTDPEMMLVRNGHLVCVQPFVQGTKTEPQRLRCGGTVQKDNALIEFATAPARNKLDFLKQIGNCFKDVMELLPSEVDLLIQPSADYPEAQLVDPETQEFFCEPDFNAWTMGMNEAPDGFEAGTFRSAGAHIHAGYVEDSGNDFLLDYEGKLNTIRTADCLLGMGSAILDNSVAALARRRLYGKPGAYRPTDYGVEYRTLSNFWIQSPVFVLWAHSFMEDTLKIVREKKHIGLINDLHPDRVQSTIMTGDEDMARHLMAKYVQPLVSDESWTRFKDSELLSRTTVDFKKEWEGVNTYVSANG